MIGTLAMAERLRGHRWCASNLMKGHLPARYHNVRRQILPEEKAMNIPDRATQVGMDVHRTFSTTSLRNRAGQVLCSDWSMWIVRRCERRLAVGRRTVVLEGTVGCSWMSHELLVLNMDAALFKELEEKMAQLYQTCEPS